MALPSTLSSYQRNCVREFVADGYQIGDDWRYTTSDEEMASVTVRRGDYENRVAFPRTKAVEDYYRRCPVCGGLNPGDITHTRC